LRRIAFRATISAQHFRGKIMADETTLRTIGESLATGIAATSETLTTSAPLDWPVWVWFVAAPIGLVVLLMIIAGVTNAGGPLRDLARDLRPLIPGARPPEPHEKIHPHDRTMWANRVGKYSSDQSERDRWENGEGEFSEDAEERLRWARELRART
jgi:hypothetical protein